MKCFRSRVTLSLRHRLKFWASVLPCKDCGSLKWSISLSGVTFHYRYLLHRILALFGRQNGLNKTKRHRLSLQCSVSWWLRWWSLQKSFDWVEHMRSRRKGGVRVEGTIERPHRANTTRLGYTLWLSLLLMETKFLAEDLTGQGGGGDHTPVQGQSEILHRDRHYQTELRLTSPKQT
jgi:hypothetical protein